MPGFPPTCPPGRHENFIATRKLYDQGSGVLLIVTVRPGYEGYFRLYVDGIPAGPARWVTSTKPQEFRGNYESAGTNHTVNLCPQGGFPGEVNASPQLTDFTKSRADFFNFLITPVLESFSYGDSTQLSSWSLTGLQRFTNCDPVEDRPTWGALDVMIENDAGVYTVSLYKQGVLMAQGSRTGNGSITLEEQNDSGVSGSVSIAFSAEVSEGAKVITRWPAAYKIHFKTSSFSGGDFPRTAEDTVYDDGKSNTFPYRSASGLAAGTYYLVVHQVDDCNNESGGTGPGETVTIYAPPGAPGVASYVSGNYSNTQIQFEASATSGATYNIYDSKDTGVLDTFTAAATHIAGTGTLAQTLAAISSGFTGIRRVLIRAVKSGVEDGNAQVLEIEYDSGVVIPPRPPVPTAGKNISISGRTITVPFTVVNILPDATPYSIELAFVDTSNSQVDTLPDALGKVISGTMIVTLAGEEAEGLYYFKLRTKTAGGQASEWSEDYGPVMLETTAPSDPTISNLRPGDA